MRFVPGLKRNLISLGTLDNAGFTYKSEKGNLTVYKGSTFKMSDTLKNGMYVLNGSTILGEVNIASDQNVKATHQWHKRLAHISSKGLDHLYK